MNLPWAKLYTITGIRLDLTVVVAGFATGIWAEVTIVVTAIGVGSAGKVGFMGKGCTNTLTLNLLFTGALALFFFSAFLGTGVFHGKELLSGKKVLVCGCGWGWVPSLPSSSK